MNARQSRGYACASLEGGEPEQKAQHASLTTMAARDLPVFEAVFGQQ